MVPDHLFTASYALRSILVATRIRQLIYCMHYCTNL